MLRVEDVDTAPVAQWGPAIESHPRRGQVVYGGYLTGRDLNDAYRAERLTMGGVADLLGVALGLLG